MIDYKECWEQLEKDLKTISRYKSGLVSIEQRHIYLGVLDTMKHIEQESQIESQRRDMSKDCPF